jgi:hypothetical protein
VHVAVDGAVPLLSGWKVKLGMVPFFISAALVLVSLLVLLAPARMRRVGFVVACCAAFLAAASILVPLIFDGEFAPGSYPYPGGKLFGVIQLAGYLAIAALLRRPLASNNALEQNARPAASVR